MVSLCKRIGLSLVLTLVVGVHGVQAQVAFCGDSWVQEPSEECDDGNGRDGDGCSSDCLFEKGTCGDKVVQRLLGEQCEPALHDAALPYLCTTSCRYFSRFCGDGTLHAGEECDLGPDNANTPDASCRMDCSLPQCGDAVLDPGSLEECDDGNTFSGDGCDRQCRSEHNASTNLPGNIVELPFATGSSTMTVRTGSTMAQTGPEVIAVLAAGAAAGYAWIRRRR